MSNFSYAKLKGRIVEKCGTQSEFALRVGKDRSLINLALNGKRDFTQSEILKSCEVLGIGRDDIGLYFFESCVEKTQS